MGSLGYIGLLEGFYKVYRPPIYGSYNGNYPPENVLDVSRQTRHINRGKAQTTWTQDGPALLSEAPPTDDPYVSGAPAGDHSPQILNGFQKKHRTILP